MFTEYSAELPLNGAHGPNEHVTFKIPGMLHTEHGITAVDVDPNWTPNVNRDPPNEHNVSAGPAEHASTSSDGDDLEDLCPAAVLELQVVEPDATPEDIRMLMSSLPNGGKRGPPYCNCAGCAPIETLDDDRERNDAQRWVSEDENDLARDAGAE